MPDVPRVLASPVFSRFAFPSGGITQYADAMLRATFPNAETWHTLLGKPEVKPVRIGIPAGYGYILTSKKTNRSFAIIDLEFVQKELFKELPRQDGKLVIAVTHNAAYYALAGACALAGLSSAVVTNYDTLLEQAFQDARPSTDCRFAAPS